MLCARYQSHVCEWQALYSPKGAPQERFVLELRQPRPQRDEGALRALDRPQSGRCHLEGPLGAAPPR